MKQKMKYRNLLLKKVQNKVWLKTFNQVLRKLLFFKVINFESKSKRLLKK